MNYKASVKVMRSYDYCHFEVNLGTDEPLDECGVDDMRKTAATLADMAVEDYKKMKSHEANASSRQRDKAAKKQQIDFIKGKPEGERTINEVAILNASEDAAFWANQDDEWDYFSRDEERDFHFARLAARKTVRP